VLLLLLLFSPFFNSRTASTYDALKGTILAQTQVAASDSN
jgi:hypothetical protein